MPNNYILPGLKRMSFKDFMSNDNYFNGGVDLEPVDDGVPGNTLNGMRTDKALKSPYADDVEFRPINDSPAIDEAPKTVDIKPSDPLKIENIFADNAKTSKDATMDAIPEFAKKKIFGLSGDEFVSLAGGLAQALAPQTAQGRIGGVLSKFAQPIISARRKAIAEAPEKELTKRLTEAKIANLEKADDPKTAIAWYLKNNPKATPEQVASFKKSLATDQPGAYWRTTSDDGTVTIYKGGTPIHTSKPGVGKTQKEGVVATEEAGYQRESDAIGKTKATTKKTPTPVNWGSASKSLSSRFGKQDATGNFIITKDLQNLHRLAQKKLVDLKGGGLDPLDAVNKAEDYARKVEESYWEYIDNAGINPETKEKLSSKQRETNIAKTNEGFKRRYGYVPQRRPR